MGMVMVSPPKTEGYPIRGSDPAFKQGKADQAVTSVELVRCKPTTRLTLPVYQDGSPNEEHRLEDRTLTLLRRPTQSRDCL